MPSSTPPLLPPQKPPRPPGQTPKVVLVLLVLLGAGAGIFIAFVAWGGIRIYDGDTGSMAPTLQKGDRFLSSRLIHNYRRGDIVVFSGPRIDEPEAMEIFAKRIVGLPGETLQIENGTLLVDGVPTPIRNRLGENIFYAHLSTTSFLTKEGESITVPAGCYFLLGDNSWHSYDSRFFGSISADAIHGCVFWSLAPSPRGGSLR